MNECFPPTAIYIVAATVVTMFVAVVAKTEKGVAFAKNEYVLAFSLLVVLLIPFVQLMLLIWTTVFTRECGDMRLNNDAWWLFVFHGLTTLPLPVAAVVWLWCRIRSREAS